jgi:carboxymethylenebutenolidase
MKKTTRLVQIAAILIFCVAPALQAAQKTETVQYRSGDETVSGYLAVPDTQGRHPAIIVIHEFWGLTDWVKGETDKLANHGYVALAVDLYRGKSTDNPEIAHELMRGLPQDRAIRDLKAAFTYLAARRDVDKSKIGVVGWCMGGGYSVLLAENEPRLAACIVNYGALPTEPSDIAKIKAPILGNFGAEDHGIPPSAVNAFVAAMKSAGKQVDVKIYDGAGHAFENPGNKTGYRPEAAKDSWGRILGFLNEKLK